MGSRYVSCFLSNQIAVSHSFSSMVAVAFIRPQPSSCHFKFSLISFDISIGSEMKYHPACPADFHNFPEKVYLIFACTCCYFSFSFQFVLIAQNSKLSE